MTTNMRNAIEQAACDVGRALAKYEMLVEAYTSPAPAGTLVESPAGTSKRRHAEFSAERKDLAIAKAKESKAPVIARGVKKASAPRTSGVKKGVLELIASHAMTTAAIVSTTGFKETSVISTLAGLKKEGLALQDENKLWHPAGGGELGNAEDHESDMASQGMA